MARTLPVRAHMAEIGRIRIGASTPHPTRKTKSGEPLKVPQRLDAFRLTSQDRAIIELAAGLYGGTVDPWRGAGGVAQWQVITEANALRVVVQGHAAIKACYEQWEGEECQLRCDGATVLQSVRVEDVGKPCWCNDSEDSAHKLVVRMPCTLPDVAPYGVWRLDSHGINATANLLGVARMRAAQGYSGHAAFEGMLRLEQMRSGGRLVRVPVLHPMLSAPPGPPATTLASQAQDAIDALFGPEERPAADEAIDDEQPEEAQDVAERAVLLDRIHELFGELDRSPEKYLAGLLQRAGVADEEALPLTYLARAVERLEDDVALRVAQREASVETTDTDIPF